MKLNHFNNSIPHRPQSTLRAALPGASYLRRAKTFLKERLQGFTLFVAASDDPDYLQEVFGGDEDVVMAPGGCQLLVLIDLINNIDSLLWIVSVLSSVNSYTYNYCKINILSLSTGHSSWLSDSSSSLPPCSILTNRKAKHPFKQRSALLIG